MKIARINLFMQLGFVCYAALNVVLDCFCEMRIAVTVKGHCEGEACGNPGWAV